MRTWRRVVVVLVVLGTAFLFYRWWEHAAARVDAVARVAGQAGDDEAAAGTGVGRNGSGAGPEGAGRGAHGTSPALDRAKADRMREQIRALLAEAGPFVAGAPASAASAAPRAGGFPSMPVVPDGDGGAAKVDPDYLKNVIARDFYPLAKDCYLSALAKRPDVAGRAVVHFEILGDRKVGGVVSDAKLVDGTTIDDPEFRTCVTESMMSVSFDAPPEDGTLSVTVPMRFSPTPRDAAPPP